MHLNTLTLYGYRIFTKFFIKLHMKWTSGKMIRQLIQSERSQKALEPYTKY